MSARAGSVAVLLAVAGGAPPLPPMPVEAAAAAASAQLELVAVEQLSPRLAELRVHSPALERETSLRVLTPDGFDPATDHLPVLWLLHGGNDDYRSWTDKGAAEELTADLPLIVVMPDTGPGGWYSNWRNRTSQGPQAWETYHLDELRPWIEQRYGARTDRAGRAIAGLSMGGFGTMHDTARHPDLFGFAASFSGAVDSRDPAVAAVIDVSPLAMQGAPGDIWGDPVLHETDWRANNPVDLAENLRPVELQVRTGNGQPGGPHGGGPDAVEAGVHHASTTFHQRLAELGIDHVFVDRGPGAHDWPYWQDDLAATLPRAVAHAAEPPPEPTTMEHLAFEPSFSVWGWDVDLDRPVLEAARLSMRPDGFALAGTGRGTVTTPARFSPGEAVRVAATDDAGALAMLSLTAGADGRLVVPVDLGPPSSVDQYPLATAAPTRFAKVDVRFTTASTGETSSGGHGPAASAAGELPATGREARLAIAAGCLVMALAARAVARRRLTTGGRS